MNKEVGKMYVVATPIGNLDDFSNRACSILSQVDWIAAEDTRESQKLLNHYGIQKKLISLHNFNEASRIQDILERLRKGEQGALISDAGTPGISDPGGRLVRALHERQIPVVPIPGPCALTSALSVSGIVQTEFLFLGFLPATACARRIALEKVESLSFTLIFYEAPHRILDMLQDCEAILGSQRRVMVARELTKKYETLYVNHLQSLVSDLKDQLIPQKGEFVIIIEGNYEKNLDNQEVNIQKAKILLSHLLNELSLKSAVNLAAKITDFSKNTLYDWAIELHNKSEMS